MWHTKNSTSGLALRDEMMGTPYFKPNIVINTHPKSLFTLASELWQNICTRPEILMRQMHKSEGWVHWTSIKIEGKVHYFVTILTQKVNMQL